MSAAPTCVLPDPVTIRSRPARPGVAAPPAGTAGDPYGGEARVDWIVLVVLLALAAALAGQGAWLVARGRRAADADPTAGGRGGPGGGPPRGGPPAAADRGRSEPAATGAELLDGGVQVRGHGTDV